MCHLLRMLTIILAASVIACSQSEKGQSSSDINTAFNAAIHDFKRESLPGAKLTRKNCSPCHFLDRNITKVGPTLKGIVGRTPTISGVPFSKWDEKTLDLWIQNPSAIKPRTMMAMPGIKSAKDRAAIIQYLKQFK